MSNLKLLTMTEVAEQIPLLSTAAADVQNRIHVIACSTLDHVRAHGDTRGVTSLMNALPKGQRVKALAAWYKGFSNSKIMPKLDKDSGLWTITLAKGRGDTDFNVDGACETTFADFTVEREPVSVSVDSLIRNIVRTATNVETFDGTDTPKVSPEAREVASKIVAFLTEQGIRKAA